MAYNKMNSNIGIEEENGIEINKSKKKKYNGPRMMSKKQVEEAVCWILGDDAPSDFGKCMRLVMQELKGNADNKLIRQVVQNYK